MSKPAWWVLYLLVPLLGVLAFLDREFIVSVIGQEIAEVGIVVIVFGLMLLWIHANAQAIAEQDKRDRGYYRLVPRVDSKNLRAPERPKELERYAERNRQLK